ncbi:MAG: type II secretion system protein [Betaproteobacteria bacterium]|nr:type II secretion system protein [Betaproteobacteria bacterium]
MVMRQAQSHQGFALLFALMLVGILAVGMTGAELVWSTEAKEQREAQLLDVGAQYRQAIRSYLFAVPGRPAYPQSVRDLLRDPRFPQVVRHLRQAYLDPMTGKPLQLIRDPVSHGIVGVYSAEPGSPLKVGSFPRDDAGFKGAKSYAQWRFVFEPLVDLSRTRASNRR